MTTPFASPTGDDIAAALLARRPAYAPDLRPREGGPLLALTRIAAEYLESLGERVVRMPDKHLTALLDMVGVSLLPAQPASSTVVFTALPGATASRVVSGTRLGAKLPGLSAPLPFETGAPVAVTGSALAEIWTVEPGADAAANHGPDLVAGRGTTLFAGGRRVERVLALGDPLRLALNGRAEIHLDVTLRAPASHGLALEWSWWDGATWRPFVPFVDPGVAGDDDSLDGTGGLTRSGRIRLVTPCGKAKPLTIEGIESCWIQARTTVPLAPRPDLVVPEIAALRLRTVLSRAPVRMTIEQGVFGGPRVAGFSADGQALASAAFTRRTLSTPVPDSALTFDTLGVSQDAPAPGTTFAYALGSKPDDEDFLTPITLGPADVVQIGLTRQRGVQPDKAIGDEKSLDTTRSFQPLGQSPGRGAAFYLACDDLFAKPGARIALSLNRPKTASEEADEKGVEYQGSIQKAQEFIKSITTTTTTALGYLTALNNAGGLLATALPNILINSNRDTKQWYDDARKKVIASLKALAEAGGRQPPVFAAVLSAETTLAGGGDPNDRIAAARQKLDGRHHDIALAGAGVAEALASLADSDVGLKAAAVKIRAAVGVGDEGGLVTAQSELQTAFNNAGGLVPFLTGARPDYLAMEPEEFHKKATERINAAKNQVDLAITKLTDVVNKLSTLDVQTLITAAAGNKATDLITAQLTWEYWNGGRWRELAVTGKQEVRNFGATGVIRFEVPEGWAPIEVVNDKRRWLRARLSAGSYSHLRLVSWTDPKSSIVNFLPVVEPRPPVLDGIEIFFSYESPSAPPAQALRHNDFQWEDVTPGLALPGLGFAPFRPMPDRAPTLYLGFDGPLPADRLGLYVQLRDPDPDAQPLAVTWEGHDGIGWRTLSVDDGTRGLTAHGVVGLLWPGDASPPGAAVLGAAARTVTLADRDGASRFDVGDRVVVRDPGGGEPGIVVTTGSNSLTLRDPVSRAYIGGEVVDAPPARFGIPRTWLRARFDATADTPAIAVAALLMNATDVWQTESVADEVAGSSDGSPRQIVFARRSPILEDEAVEVRELEGQRAPVDLPILERELVAAGMAGAMRIVRDARSGEISEVWVRWAMRPSLGLSAPGDRHYTVDRSGGRVIFGDGVHGRIPPVAANNIRASYRTGGGAAGNVGAGEISALISAVPASKAANPLPASGGAEGEGLETALVRGSSVLRHRRMAITAGDAGDLAHETCPAVARSRVVGGRDEFGRPLPGHTRVIVIPDVDEPRPQPDAELRRRVRVELAARASATAAAGIVVIGPDYVPVGAAVAVRPSVRAEPGVVRMTVLAELERFLHPLRGAADGGGFDFGRSVFLSDLARALEALDGVDVVTAVALTRDGVEQGERVDVEAGQLVCAGPLSVTLAGGAG